jgi:hypothetical protein
VQTDGELRRAMMNANTVSLWHRRMKELRGVAKADEINFRCILIATPFLHIRYLLKFIGTSS